MATTNDVLFGGIYDNRLLVKIKELVLCYNKLKLLGAKKAWKI